MQTIVTIARLSGLVKRIQRAIIRQFRMVPNISRGSEGKLRGEIFLFTFVIGPRKPKAIFS